MGVSERGVEDCKPAGEALERPLRLKEGLLWPLSSSRSVALMGVGNWLPKDVSTINLVRGEESPNPVVTGSQVSPAAGTERSRLAAEEEELAAVEKLAAVEDLAAMEDLVDVWEQTAVMIPSSEEASGAACTAHTA